MIDDDRQATFIKVQVGGRAGVLYSENGPPDHGIVWIGRPGVYATSTIVPHATRVGRNQHNQDQQETQKTKALEGHENLPFSLLRRSNCS